MTDHRSGRDLMQASILVYRVWWVNWEKLVEVGCGFRYDGGMKEWSEEGFFAKKKKKKTESYGGNNNGYDDEDGDDGEDGDVFLSFSADELKEIRKAERRNARRETLLRRRGMPEADYGLVLPDDPRPDSELLSLDRYYDFIYDIELDIELKAADKIDGFMLSNLIKQGFDVEKIGVSLENDRGNIFFSKKNENINIEAVRNLLKEMKEAISVGKISEDSTELKVFLGSSLSKFELSLRERPSQPESLQPESLQPESLQPESVQPEVPPLQEKNILGVVEYLKGDAFIDDLNKAYPEIQKGSPKGFTWAEVSLAAKKIRDFGLGEIVFEGEVKKRNYVEGKKFIRLWEKLKRGEFLKNDSKVFFEKKLLQLKIDNDLLILIFGKEHPYFSEVDATVKEKKTEIWTNETYSQLYDGGYKSDPGALVLLKNKGINLLETINYLRGADRKTYDDLAKAVWIMYKKGSHVEERDWAKKTIKDCFRDKSSGIDDKSNIQNTETEKVPNIPNIKEDVEKKRIEAIQVKYREMSEEEVFSRFEGWIASKASRGGEVLRAWKARVSLVPEKDRESVVNQLRSTLMLLENTEARLVHFNYWSKTAMGILRGLSLADKV